MAARLDLAAVGIKRVEGALSDAAQDELEGHMLLPARLQAHPDLAASHYAIALIHEKRRDWARARHHFAFAEAAFAGGDAEDEAADARRWRLECEKKMRK